ncbi:MAG TPA: exodeoxyribonuclease VII small subunit [Candidatus Aminicenantes bacterium]|nr:exodeoxyribonuclease VII small subunit [Candidatus Aminicenantes bacterium]
MVANRKDQVDNYEHNFAVLERITDALNKDEIGIDDLLEKTREALEAARRCMEILNRQRGEFRKLENEFARLIQDSESQTSKNEDGEDKAE